MQNKTFKSVRLCSPKLVDFRQSESYKIERSCDAVSHNVAHTGNSCPILLLFSAGMFGRACPRSDRRYFWDPPAYTAIYVVSGVPKSTSNRHGQYTDDAARRVNFPFQFSYLPTQHPQRTRYNLNKVVSENLCSFIDGRTRITHDDESRNV